MLNGDPIIMANLWLFKRVQIIVMSDKMDSKKFLVATVTFGEVAVVTGIDQNYQSVQEVIKNS